MLVVPAVSPVTTPPVLTVATPVAELLQTPPFAPSANVTVNAGQTVYVPLMEPADGDELIVTTEYVVAVPQLLVTA